MLDAGIDTVVLGASAPRRQQAERFAGEVAPAVRAAVDADRGR